MVVGGRGTGLTGLEFGLDDLKSNSCFRLLINESMEKLLLALETAMAAGANLGGEGK